MKNNGEAHNHQNHMNHSNQMHHDNYESHNHHSGHAHHHGNFKVKFFVSLIFGIPIILLSPLMGVNLPFQFTFPGSEWVVLIYGAKLMVGCRL